MVYIWSDSRPGLMWHFYSGIKRGVESFECKKHIPFNLLIIKDVFVLRDPDGNRTHIKGTGILHFIH